MGRPRTLCRALLAASLAIAACSTPPPAAVTPPPPPPPPPAPRHAVVLLPEADGTAGRVTVSNEAGSRTLESAGSSTRILDARTAPTEPAPMSAGEIEELFGATLAAQPAPPLHFTLYFEPGSAALTPESRRDIGEILAAIRERASVDTSVVGHTDTAGDPEANRELSLRRAVVVGSLLTGAGVAPEALDITSHGEANPLVPTGDNVSEPRNRRVEVTVR